jgi:hypothetical protein
MLAPGNPLLGRTLVAACHCTQCTKKTPRFLRRGLAVGRSYAVKGSQIGHQTRCLHLPAFASRGRCQQCNQTRVRLHAFRERVLRLRVRM